jgi:sugar phosphate isomerase/epimerase
VNLPGDAGREARDLFCEYLQLGADLGVPWIRSINNTTFAGSAPPMSPQEAFARTAEGLRQIAPVARQLNIGLLLENNENTVTPDAESLLRLKRDLGDVCRVGIAFDPVNAYFQGLDVDQGLDLLAGHIDILHLKNVRRSREKRWDYVPRGDDSYAWTTLAGGDLDWKTLLQRAADAGFDGPLVYEYVNPFKGMPLRYWDTLPEPEDAARKESLFLRKILDELSTGDR